MLTRRDMIKLGLVGTGCVILGPDGRVSWAHDDELPPSPPTTPFMDELPVPPEPPQVPRFFDIPDDYNTPIPYVGVNTKFFEIIAEERRTKFHSAWDVTSIWGYRPSKVVENGMLVDGKDKWPFVFGPTFVESRGDNTLDGGTGLLVRHVNDLPEDQPGFGTTRLTVHLHGGHHAARADGFPENIDFPGFPNPVVIERRGDHLDYLYPTLDPGFIDNTTRSPDFPVMTTERPATMWYHDHIIDFTGPNAYRGLAGFFLVFDVPSASGMTPGGNPTGAPFQDLGSEKDPTGLQLPSGIPQLDPTTGRLGPGFDIPLVIQDKRFDANYALVFNSFDHDGFLGDKFVVNGAIQPFLRVKRRKYRFRFLNGSNARIYTMFLTSDSGQKFPMTQIATEGGLLSRPIPNIASFTIAMAERVEVVIDFADPMFDAIAESSRPFVYIENRLEQTEGRKPDGLVSRGVQILQFILEERVPDPSRVGKDPSDPTNPFAGNLLLRPFDKIFDSELQQATRRSFKFDRSHGGWTINGELAGKLETAVADPRLEQGEIWHLENSSGGWWHPIHIHSEFFRVLRRNGRTPPLAEQDGIAKKDTILLRGGENVDVFLKFRDHLGPFVFHCHNMEHEDMAMMARFDVIE